MNSNMTPQSVASNGVITATDEDGNTHHFHTDEDESKAFAFASMCLSAGRDELFLLLYSDACPQYAEQRHKDGRSDEQLKADWLTKVTNAGMPRASASRFLTERLALND